MKNPGVSKSKILDTDAAIDRISNKLLTWSTFMAPIGTFVQCKMDKDIADKKTEFAKASKREPVAAAEVYGNFIKEPPI